jgi:N-acetylglucosamine malate deacetylase 1
MKVLAIGAHPDDIEIFMYGILSIYFNRGDKIFTIIATDGSKGSLKPDRELVITRKEETKKAIGFFGDIFFLDYPDGDLSTSFGVAAALKDHVNRIKPDLVITHSPEDYHSDHVSLANFVTNATGFMCPIIFCDTLLGVDFNPDFYVDITKYFTSKTQAILCHKSQQPKKYVNSVKILNRFRAAQCNAGSNQYAEAFRWEKKFPYSDIRSLIPPSPEIKSLNYKYNKTKLI